MEFCLALTHEFELGKIEYARIVGLGGTGTGDACKDKIVVNKKLSPGYGYGTSAGVSKTKSETMK